MATAVKPVLVAFLALIIWAGLSVFVSVWQAGANTGLGDLVRERFVLGPPVAALFMLAVVHLNGWWKDIGLQAPRPGNSVFLLWLPAVYILVLFAFGMAITPPAASVLAMVAINTLIVGISEELAFRGVLWGRVRRVMPFWTGFLIVTVAFGSVHMLNGFLTGDWGGAAVQSVNAAASGAAYLAFRIRNRSIIPIMILHWLWDFAVFTVSAGGAPVEGVKPDPLTTLIFSSALVGPILLCGLFLIRNERVRQGWRDDTLPQAAAARSTQG